LDDDPDGAKTEFTTSVHCATPHFQIESQRIALIQRDLCQCLGVVGSYFHVEVVDAPTIQELNQQYRQKGKPTDVLSFPQVEHKKPVALKQPLPKLPNLTATAVPDDDDEFIGDIAICADVAEAQAKEIGQGLDREFVFLLIHGFLHLNGYDHIESKDEAVMLKAQQELIARYGSVTPPLWEKIIWRVQQ
jgi:probable rRNA maturation factor